MDSAALDDLPDELTITLRRPIEFPATNGETFAELRLREPTAGEMKKAATKTGTESTIFLVFLVSGMPIGAIEQIGARDFRKASDYLLGFFGEDQATGEAA